MLWLMETLAERCSIRREQIEGIGIGVPGYVDPVQGVVHESPNLGWKSVPLLDMLRRLTGRPVWIENDANAAVLGEYWLGAGAGVSDLVMITLGTGVGCGIIADGKVIRGADGFAGEFGHTKVETKTGNLCVCGKRGCLETTSSGLAMVRKAREAIQRGEQTLLTEMSGKGETVKDIFDAAKRGDPIASSIVREAAFYLGVAMANLANLLNPRKMIIGGGISAAGTFYLSLIEQSFQQFALDVVRRNTAIVPAQLGNDAGVLGSAMAAKRSTALNNEIQEV
jgi:glucokinase